MVSSERSISASFSDFVEHGDGRKELMEGQGYQVMDDNPAVPQVVGGLRVTLARPKTTPEIEAKIQTILSFLPHLRLNA